MSIATPIMTSSIASSIAEELLAEFETQAPITRRFLERLPEDKLTWKPHDRSLSAGQLAYHLAFVPAAIVLLVQDNPVQARNSFDYPTPTRKPPGECWPSLRKVSPWCARDCACSTIRPWRRPGA